MERNRALPSHRNGRDPDVGLCLPRMTDPVRHVDAEVRNDMESSE